MLAVKSMYMEEQPVVKPHRLTMQNRSTIQVTGVSDVIAMIPERSILETSAGPFADQRGGTSHESFGPLKKERPG